MQGVTFYFKDMKTLMLVIMALALSYVTPRAQGRGHAYGRYKHEERIEHRAPGVRIYRPRPRVQYYRAPVRTYYYRRPSINFSFPFGYRVYQPYQQYYYPYTYTPQYRYERHEHEEEEEHEHRFAHERRER